jgi:chaperone required for assembly of F1-ATPase
MRDRSSTPPGPLATLDEAWQAEQWGEDEEAAAVRAARLQDFQAAYRFLELL